MIEVDLIRHVDCLDYCYWRDYLSNDAPSAVINLGEIGNPDFYYSKYLNATARNLRNKAGRLGYTSRYVPWEERNELVKDIYVINISKEERQGRAMSESYTKAPVVFTITKPKCADHYSLFFGCFANAGKLVGYITANFCGELSAASQILGHGDYLKDGIMYQLWAAYVNYCFCHGIKCIVYSRWSDGLDGLRIWKKAVGLSPMVVIEK